MEHVGQPVLRLASRMEWLCAEINTTVALDISATTKLYCNSILGGLCKNKSYETYNPK